MADDEPNHPEGDDAGDAGGARNAGLHPRDPSRRILAMERAIVDNFHNGSWPRYCETYGIDPEVDRSTL